jgi:hypothetical protein
LVLAPAEPKLAAVAVEVRAVHFREGAQMSSFLSSEFLHRSAALDWDELAGLVRIVTAYAIGDHSVVLELSDGRDGLEVRHHRWHTGPPA